MANGHYPYPVFVKKPPSDLELLHDELQELRVKKSSLPAQIGLQTEIERL